MSDLEVKKGIDATCRAYGIAELKTQQREAIMEFSFPVDLPQSPT